VPVPHLGVAAAQRLAAGRAGRLGVEGGDPLGGGPGGLQPRRGRPGGLAELGVPVAGGGQLRLDRLDRPIGGHAGAPQRVGVLGVPLGRGQGALAGPAAAARLLQRLRQVGAPRRLLPGLLQGVQRRGRGGQLGHPGGRGLDVGAEPVGLRGPRLVAFGLLAVAGRLAAGQAGPATELLERPGGLLGGGGGLLGLGQARPRGLLGGGGGQVVPLGVGLLAGRVGGGGLQLGEVGQAGPGALGHRPGVAGLLPHLREGPLDRADPQQVQDQPPAVAGHHGREGGQLLLLGADRGEEGALVHAEHPGQVGVGLADRLGGELAVEVHLDLWGEVAALEPAAHVIGVAFVLEDQLDADVLADPVGAQLPLVGPRVAVAAVAQRLDERGLAGAVRAVDADQAVGELQVHRPVDAVVAQAEGAQVHPLWPLQETFCPVRQRSLILAKRHICLGA
jgi:hypothetical protein